MRKARTIFLSVLAVIVIGFGSFVLWQSRPLSREELTRPVMTANPLDLSQIKGFSKYRSCMGHDYRGPSAATGTREPVMSSLKHYVIVRDDLRGKNNMVKAIAPFDGVISVIDRDMGGPDDQQIWLTPDIVSPRKWHFVFFHIDLADHLKKGSLIKAGEVIGTAHLTRTRSNDGVTGNFDIGMKFTRPLHVPALDAPFAHASETVLAEYARFGITPDELVVSPSQRAANPCVVRERTADDDGPDAYFVHDVAPGEYQWLQQ